MPLLDIKPYFSEVDKVIVGADRITKDAVFNKIGTYSHAVLAKTHGIPFYVAAPILHLRPRTIRGGCRDRGEGRRRGQADGPRDSSPRRAFQSTTRPSAPRPSTS